jgi:hypothetical protein
MTITDLVIKYFVIKGQISCSVADPETKKAIEIINMAEAIVDEVVTRLLNEVAEKVLKEE